MDTITITFVHYPGMCAPFEQVFMDVDEKTPCVFILSRGADPMALLMKFAASVGMDNQLEVTSLGKGQGPRAEEVIKVKEHSATSPAVKVPYLDSQRQ